MKQSLLRWRAGFSLVELMVVIAVIALLMAILIPTLTSIRRSARVVTCANNLREITRSMIAYASAGNLHRGTVANALPSVGPGTGNWGDLQDGNAGAFWLMITGRGPSDEPMSNVRNNWLQPNLLLCPSAARTGMRAPRSDDGGMLAETYSYSYLSQVPFTDSNDGRTYSATSITEAPGSLVILADRNPACEPDQTRHDSDKANQNSPNHGGRGQNVALIDQSVRWEETPTVPGATPGADEDNIYAPATGSGTKGERRYMGDSFLIP